MPINIPKNLPALPILRRENAFVMDDYRAEHQDIRPLQIAILNLMPKKIDTECQLLRLLSNTPLQIEVNFLTFEDYAPKNTPIEHMQSFYIDYKRALEKYYDGLIITGAPVEDLPFEEVHYWKELQKVMEWSLSNVTSTLHICWGAQAALFHHYSIPKYPLKEKLSGVYEHRLSDKTLPLTRGMDDLFYVPQSRWTYNKREEIKKVETLKVLAHSEEVGEAGFYMASTEDMRQVFVTGHPEYDTSTLKEEYLRDKESGKNPILPKNYFSKESEHSEIQMRWRGASSLLYANWVNYAVYQETNFELGKKN